MLSFENCHGFIVQIIYLTNIIVARFIINIALPPKREFMWNPLDHYYKFHKHYYLLFIFIMISEIIFSYRFSYFLQ